MAASHSLGSQFKTNTLTRNPGDNPDQLQLFMTPSELMKKITYSYDRIYDDYGVYESMDDLWSRKLKESKVEEVPGYWQHGAGIHKLLATSGWNWDHRVPLAHTKYGNDGTWETRISNAHHRVASANEIDPNMLIPVDNTIVHKRDRNAY